MNRVLDPFVAPLFRLAARGHWLREHRPVRVAREFCGDEPLIPPQNSGNFCLRTSLDTEGDLRMVLSMDGCGVQYSLGPYPEIQEFATMLHHQEPGRSWRGMNFQASADPAHHDRYVRFQFRRHVERVTLSLLKEEWECMKDMFYSALEDLRVQLVLSALSLDYGEL